MGPEPLIFPLALIGVAGLLFLLVRVIRARGRTWFSLVLFASLGFGIWGAQGAARWDHTISIFLMASGVFVVGSAAVLAFGALILLPFKPHLAQLARKLGLAKHSLPPS